MISIIFYIHISYYMIFSYHMAFYMAIKIDYGIIFHHISTSYSVR